MKFSSQLLANFIPFVEMKLIQFNLTRQSFVYTTHSASALFFITVIKQTVVVKSSDLASVAFISADFVSLEDKCSD